MIKKIISINNYNKFILFNHSQTNWDCSLKKPPLYMHQTEAEKQVFL